MTQAILSVMLLLAALPLSAEVAYRWVDANGVVHFSDQPPQGSADVFIFPLPEYETPEPPTPEELVLQARLRQLNARIARLIDERQAERADQAEAEAAALRAELAAVRGRGDYYGRPVVRGVWYPPFIPVYPQPPPVTPPMRADSAFDRLYNSVGR